MNDEFVVVRYKKGKKKLNKKPLKVTSSLEGDCTRPLYEVIRSIQSAEIEINTSSYFKELLKVVNEQTKLLDTCVVPEILCYGLGNFSTKVNPRYQFGLLLSLKKHFSSDVFIFDPLFNKTELKLLNDYNFNVISNNERGKRKINNKLTFVYLPHCPHWLINNFLWANWGIELNNCIVLTNSFSSIILGSYKETLTKKLRYLEKISPGVTEVELNNSFKYNDIFNNLSFHIFLKDKINQIVNDLEFSLEEPVVNSDTEE